MSKTSQAEDVYYKKTLDYYHRGQTLQFRVSQDLFSSHQVDVGTRHLLKTLTEERIGAARKVLDLGCGYGPLGLMLKALAPGREVHLVDRDALAVAYARANAEPNGLDGVAIYGGLGYDDARARDFDLVVSNIPGKAGEPVIAHLLLEARHVLVAGGRVAVVVVKPLEELVLAKLAGAEAKVLCHEAWGGHAVFHYCFPKRTATPAPAESALHRGIYHRADFLVETEAGTLDAQTLWGLPEFDSLSYRSQMLIDAVMDVPGAVRRAIVFNPGQGHVAGALWLRCAPASLRLVDRDLLSLRATRHNLLRNDCPQERIALAHQVGLAGDRQADLIAGALREDEGQEAIAATVRQAAGQLAPGGTMLIAAGSTPITRVEKVIRAEKLLRVQKRKKYKGRSLLILRQK